MRRSMSVDLFISLCINDNVGYRDLSGHLDVTLVAQNVDFDCDKIWLEVGVYIFYLSDTISEGKQI
jgi:hypothetical protein